MQIDWLIKRKRKKAHFISHVKKIIHVDLFSLKFFFSFLCKSFVFGGPNHYLYNIPLCKFHCIHCWSKWNPLWSRSQSPCCTVTRKWSGTGRFSRWSVLSAHLAPCTLCMMSSNDDIPSSGLWFLWRGHLSAKLNHILLWLIWY